MESNAVIYAIVATALVFAYLFGDSAGHKKGKKLGYSDGVGVGRMQERLVWMEKARSADRNGTPWFGIELPPEVAPEDESA